MSDFKFKDLKGKVVIHCKTSQEANNCCDFLASIGLKWSDRISYRDITRYDGYGEETCYNVKDGMYQSMTYYEKIGYKVVEWVDIARHLRKKFLK